MELLRGQNTSTDCLSGMVNGMINLIKISRVVNGFYKEAPSTLQVQ